MLGNVGVGTAMMAQAMFLCVFSGLPDARGAEARNLVANGDFSQVQAGKPLEWQTSGDENVTQTLEVASEGGNPCAKLVCTRFEAKTPASHAMIAQCGHVALKAGKVYEMSLRIRAERLTGGCVNAAIMDTKTWDSCGFSEGLEVGPRWQEFRRVFRAACSADRTTRLQFWFTEVGTLYLDDVRLIEVTPKATEFADVIPPTGRRNMVFNGSFEVGATGWTSLGKGTGWGGLAVLHGKIVSSGGTHGRAFLRIPLGGGDTPVLHFDYYLPVERRELEPLAASLGWIPVEPNAPYTLSCDLRASENGVSAVVGARSGDPAGARTDHRRPIVLSDTWTRYTHTFRPTHRYAFVTVGPSVKEEKKVHIDVDAVQLEKGEHGTPFEGRSLIEVGAEPSQAAGLFEQGDSGTLRVRAHNYSPSPRSVRVDFDVRDFFDHPITLPSESIAVPGLSGVQREIPLPSEWMGYYQVRMCYKADDVAGSQTVRLVFIPRRSGNDSVVGMNHAFATPFLIRLAGKAGVSWYRDWSLKWQHIEPSAGVYRWEIADAQIGRVLREGVQVLPLLPPYPSADWNSEAPARPPTDAYPGIRWRQAWAPKEPRLLGDFVAGAVGRYKDRIHVWEFLNEPIYTDYALPKKPPGDDSGRGYTPADYVRLLEVAAGGIRRADPGCRIIGGIAGMPTSLTREVIEAGCLKHVDIFNLHIYPGATRPEGFIRDMDNLLSLMDRHGGRKPIWITEFSYYGSDSLPCCPLYANSAGWATLLKDERRCAEYTVRFFTIMLARGVEKVFLHAGSSGTANEWTFECCLFEQGGSPRKVLAALALFAELMGPRPAYAGERSFDRVGHCYAFETGKRSVLVLWAENDGVGMPVAIPSAECIDFMGNRVSAQPTALSPTPTYLVGSSGKAKDLLNQLAR